MNDLTLCCTFSQLARRQNGSVNVVSRTKYSDSPSTPNRRVKKLVLSLVNCVTNW